MSWERTGQCFSGTGDDTQPVWPLPETWIPFTERGLAFGRTDSIHEGLDSAIMDVFDPTEKNSYINFMWIDEPIQIVISRFQSIKYKLEKK